MVANIDIDVPKIYWQKKKEQVTIKILVNMVEKLSKLDDLRGRLLGSQNDFHFCLAGEYLWLDKLRAADENQ